MSRGIAALEKGDQARVREWLRLEALARESRGGWYDTGWTWLHVLLHALCFLAGLACGRWLL